MSLPPTTDRHIIVGGGAIGLSLAWELARRRQPVTLIQPEQPPALPASWAGAGILPPAATRGAVDPYEQLKTLSHQLHPQWARQLQAETGIDTGFRPCGGIYLAGSRAELATLIAQEYWWEQHGIQYQRLNRHQLEQLEPHLSALADDRLQQAWLLPEEYQLRNPRHLQALRVACQRLGVDFQNDAVERIDVAADGQASLRTRSGEPGVAGSICLCAGAWTRWLLDQLRLDNGLMPVRGQMILYQTPSVILSRIVNEGNRYLVPRDDGLMLAGSVEEEVGFVCQTTEAALSQIRRGPARCCPS